MSTPVADAAALVTFVPVWILMPCFLNDFSSSAEIASSSTGTSRGSSSMIVTSLPKRRKIDANSTPTAPLPRMAIDFGTSLQVDRLIARDDALAIDLHAGHAARRGTGGDHDLARGAQALRFAIGDVHLPAPGDPRRALDPFNLVLLEQKLHALRQARDDLVLARLHLVHVDADGAFADRDAPLLDVLHHLQRVRMLQQGLCRNAAPDQAGAAERLLPLHHGHFQSQLRRPDGRDIPARSRANHDDIEFARHLISDAIIASLAS